MSPIPVNFQAVVLEALGLYGQSHELNATSRQDAKLDFERFYMTAVAFGLRGIRWNFNGCIICKEPTYPSLLRRILVVEKEVVKAAEGRGLGTVVCSAHDCVGVDSAHREVLVAGALRRINEEPPPPRA